MKRKIKEGFLHRNEIFSLLEMGARGGLNISFVLITFPWCGNLCDGGHYDDPWWEMQFAGCCLASFLEFVL